MIRLILSVFLLLQVASVGAQQFTINQKTGKVQINLGGGDFNGITNVLKSIAYGFNGTAGPKNLDLQGYPINNTGWTSGVYTGSANNALTTAGPYVFMWDQNRQMTITLGMGATAFTSCSSHNVASITACTGTNNITIETNGSGGLTDNCNAIGVPATTGGCFVFSISPPPPTTAGTSITVTFPFSGVYAADSTLGNMALVSLANLPSYTYNMTTDPTSGGGWTPQFTSVLGAPHPDAVRFMGMVEGLSQITNQCNWADRPAPNSISYNTAIWAPNDLVTDANNAFVGTDAYTTAGNAASNGVGWVDCQTFQGFLQNLQTHISITNAVRCSTVAGCTNNTDILLTVTSTSTLTTNQQVWVTGIAGTVEANTNFLGGLKPPSITVVDSTHIQLNGVTFINPWTTSTGTLGTQTLTVTNHSGGAGAKFIGDARGVPLQTPLSAPFPTSTSVPGTYVYKADLDIVMYVADGTDIGITRAVPYEVQANLANSIGANLWVTIPGLASLDYMRQAGAAICAAMNKPQQLFTFLEISNEQWNSNWVIWTYSQSVGSAWGIPETSNRALFSWYAYYVKQMATEMVSGCPGAGASRLLPLIGVQFGGPGSFNATYRMAGASLGGEPAATITGITASTAPAANASLSWSGSIVTVTTAAPHGITPSTTAYILINGVSPAGYNGIFLATASASNPDVFTYPLSNPGVETVPGTWATAPIISLSGLASAYIVGQALTLTGITGTGCTALNNTNVFVGNLATTALFVPTTSPFTFFSQNSPISTAGCTYASGGTVTPYYNNLGLGNYYQSPNRPVDVATGLAYAWYYNGQNFNDGVYGANQSPAMAAMQSNWLAGNQATALSLLNADTLGGTLFATNFSCPASGSIINLPGNVLVNGYIITFTTTGTPCSGISLNTAYCVEDVGVGGAGNFQITAVGLANQSNAGLCGVTPITLGPGTGTQSVGIVGGGGSQYRAPLLYSQAILVPQWEQTAASFDSGRAVPLGVYGYEGGSQWQQPTVANCVAMGLSTTGLVTIQHSTGAGSPAIQWSGNTMQVGDRFSLSTAAPAAITSLAWNSGTVNATTAAPHGIPVSGQATVIITLAVGATVPTGYNGTVTATSTGATTFTYPKAVDPGTETSPGVYQFGLPSGLGIATNYFAINQSSLGFDPSATYYPLTAIEPGIPLYTGPVTATTCQAFDNLMAAYKNGPPGKAITITAFNQMMGLDPLSSNYGLLPHSKVPSWLTFQGNAGSGQNGGQNQFSLLQGTVNLLSFPPFQTYYGFQSYSTPWLLKRDLAPASNDNTPAFMDMAA